MAAVKTLYNHNRIKYLINLKPELHMACLLLPCNAGVPVQGEQKAVVGEGEGLKNREGEGVARLERERLQCG